MWMGSGLWCGWLQCTMYLLYWAWQFLRFSAIIAQESIQEGSVYFEFMEADDKHLYSFVGSHICCHVVRCVTMASVCELIWETPFSCDLVVPRPFPHVRERGSGVLSDFSCQMGRDSSQSERSNQIAECVIICNDLDNRAWDLALQTEGRCLSKLICCSQPQQG